MKTIKQAILFFIVAIFLLSNLVRSLSLKKIKEIQDGAENQELEVSEAPNSSSDPSLQESLNDGSTPNHKSSENDTSASLQTSSPQCFNDVIKF